MRKEKNFFLPIVWIYPWNIFNLPLSIYYLDFIDYWSTYKVLSIKKIIVFDIDMLNWLKTKGSFNKFVIFKVNHQCRGINIKHYQS